jgi:hypothetical protein
MSLEERNGCTEQCPLMEDSRQALANLEVLQINIRHELLSVSRHFGAIAKSMLEGAP